MRDPSHRMHEPGCLPCPDAHVPYNADEHGPLAPLWVAKSGEHLGFKWMPRLGATPDAVNRHVQYWLSVHRDTERFGRGGAYDCDYGAVDDGELCPGGAYAYDYGAVDDVQLCPNGTIAGAGSFTYSCRPASVADGAKWTHPEGTVLQYVGAFSFPHLGVTHTLLDFGSAMTRTDGSTRHNACVLLHLGMGYAPLGGSACLIDEHWRTVFTRKGVAVPAQLRSLWTMAERQVLDKAGSELTLDVLRVASLPVLTPEAPATAALARAGWERPDGQAVSMLEVAALVCYFPGPGDAHVLEYKSVTRTPVYALECLLLGGHFVLLQRDNPSKSNAALWPLTPYAQVRKGLDKAAAAGMWVRTAYCHELQGKVLGTRPGGMAHGGEHAAGGVPASAEYGVDGADADEVVSATAGLGLSVEAASLLLQVGEDSFIGGPETRMAGGRAEHKGVKTRRSARVADEQAVRARVADAAARAQPGPVTGKRRGVWTPDGWRAGVMPTHMWCGARRGFPQPCHVVAWVGDMVDVQLTHMSPTVLRLSQTEIKEIAPVPTTERRFGFVFGVAQDPAAQRASKRKKRGKHHRRTRYRLTRQYLRAWWLTATSRLKAQWCFCLLM